MQAALTHDKLTRVSQLARAITDEVGRAFIGSPHTTEALLVALLARGHVLIEGYPGVAKTTLVKAFSATLGCHFRRIQFTPDLLPSDITGTYILDMRTNTFVLREGPVFTHVLLGDEINRAPAKTQSALLEAMQEQQVTIEGETRSLAEPFIVLATQNPIEQEGTYPLPEAQLDRFMFQVDVDYPSESEEEEIVRQQTSDHRPELQRVLSPQRILQLQELVRRVPVADHVVKYAVALARATRPATPNAPAFIKESVSWGAGPRASQFLILAAKARAILDGRFAVSTDDVAALARPTLQHRLILNYRAEAEGLRAGELVDRLLSAVAP
jgi:MoxR-like ATPase